MGIRLKVNPGVMTGNKTRPAPRTQTQRGTHASRTAPVCASQPGKASPINAVCDLRTQSPKPDEYQLIIILNQSLKYSCQTLNQERRYRRDFNEFRYRSLVLGVQGPPSAATDVGRGGKTHPPLLEGDCFTLASLARGLNVVCERAA